MIWTDSFQREFKHNILLLKDNKVAKAVADRLQSLNLQMNHRTDPMIKAPPVVPMNRLIALKALSHMTLK